MDLIYIIFVFIPLIVLVVGAYALLTRNNDPDHLQDHYDNIDKDL